MDCDQEIFKKGEGDETKGRKSRAAEPRGNGFTTKKKKVLELRFRGKDKGFPPVGDKKGRGGRQWNVGKNQLFGGSHT